MAGTRYEAGRRFEWAAREYLRRNGYDVFRTAGSKTKVDLIAIKIGQVLFIQCKRDGKISPAERSELWRIAATVGPTALPILAYKDAGRAAVLLDQLTGVGPRDRTQFEIDLACPISLEQGRRNRARLAAALAASDETDDR